MRLTGAQVLMECLLREGVTHVFGYPGGATLPMYDTLTQYPQLRHVLVRHEQDAAHAADAYARVTNKPAVCFATSGPGATNLVTGLANAWMDSIPIVAITGAVASTLIGRDGFQEADITGITIPITKHNQLVLKVEEIATAVREAFHIAGTGRPGPVLVDIPRDVLQQTAEFEYPEHVNLPGYHPAVRTNPALVKRAAQLIAESKRPLILAGHGIIQSDAYEELIAFAEVAEIPVITTLLGLSAFPGSHRLAMGMPGMHGMYWNNIAINESDLLIAVGMRFDDRVTGRLKDFAPRARIIHIDIDPAELGKNVRTTLPIHGDAKATLAELLKEVGPAKHPEWLAEIHRLRTEHPSIAIPETDKLLPQHVVKSLYDLAPDGTYFVTGVGQHQMWAAQYFWRDSRNTFVTSGGLGTMGFEVPAAMGVQFARPGALVWSFCGDGGFQMTNSELATIVEHELPVKFAVINNRYLGMVRQWQELFYKNNVVATRDFCPDFVMLAEAYGLRGIRVSRREEVEPAIRDANAHPGPVLIDFEVDPYENVYPMVPPGASLAETIDSPYAAAPSTREPAGTLRS